MIKKIIKAYIKSIVFDIIKDYKVEELPKDVYHTVTKSEGLLDLDPYMKNSPKLNMVVKYSNQFGSEEVKVETLKEIYEYCKNPTIDDEYDHISEVGLWGQCVDSKGKKRLVYINLTDYGKRYSLDGLTNILKPLKVYLDGYPETRL
jgi:hypothetical protein